MTWECPPCVTVPAALDDTQTSVDGNFVVITAAPGDRVSVAFSFDLPLVDNDLDHPSAETNPVVSVDFPIPVALGAGGSDLFGALYPTSRHGIASRW
jgi:hypothetical protein